MGTGALAGLFAARLAGAGRDVTILGSWPAGLRALRKHGIRLREADGRKCSYPIGATESPGQAGSVRYALVLVKSWQTARAAEQLTGCLAPDGLALTLQNGAGNRGGSGPGTGGNPGCCRRHHHRRSSTGPGARAGGRLRGSLFGSTSRVGAAGGRVARGWLCDGIIRGCRSSRVGQDRD